MYQQLKDNIIKLHFINDEEWVNLLPLWHFKEIKKGHQLLKEGEVCSSVYFIIEGCCRIFFLNEGKEISRQFFFENAFFTELASFNTQNPSLYYMDALEDSKLFAISYKDLTALYDKSPAFLRFGKLMADQTAIFLINRNVEIVTTHAKERYLKLMKERPKVMQRVPQYMIASYLGITPEALSRLRREILL